MLLSLRDDQKQHLTLLTSQPTNVLQDFCKLALDFLQKGPTPKLYQTVAQKLNVQPEIILNAVEGLANLIVESSRHQLSDLDFRDSVLTLGFSEEHQQTLEVFNKGKRQEIHDALSRLTLDLPHYQDLEWRFDVQLASRALHHQVTPLVTIHLTLETKQAFASGGTSRKNVVLQTDPTNLVHVTQALEEALRGSRSQHSRQIQRSFNKLNQLNMDEDALRRSERNSDDKDYVCDLVEEFYGLSSGDHNCVNQISWIEPRCKKARTSVGTLYTDSEEEIGVQGTKGYAIINVIEMGGCFW